MSKKIKIILLLMIVGTIVGIKAKTATASLIESGSRVFEDDDLTYYINIYYDGKDVTGVESNDTVTASIQSGYIHVEDEIPKGLIFNGFVETNDGTIGAINRSDGTSCPGSVIGGVDGLVYDKDAHKVSFTVKNLKAGCMLTVGVKTKTPLLEDGIDRMDFYNTAVATEGLMTVVSNTVHTWIGMSSTEQATKYNVVYQYTGVVPDNATPLPSTKEYLNGTPVSVEASAKAVGYTFSGWESSSVTVSNGVFTMPSGTVTFTGTFTSEPSYDVGYEVTGTVPTGYVVPNHNTYYEGMMVTLDSLEAGTIINGYKFLGWKSDDVVINDDNSFEMPASDVVITGSFEKEKYKVTYAFQGTEIPSGAESLLPATVFYEPGEIVTVEENPTATGYRFLGWYQDSPFEMPNEDVVIYGEWSLESGHFEPTIEYEVVDKKDYYKPGETVKYKVTVANTSNYEITDIIVQEQNEKASFIDGDGYVVSTDGIAKINSIASNSKVELYLEYVVQPTDSGKIISEVEIIGALAGENYTLNSEQEYKASETIAIESAFKLCNTVSSGSNEKVFLFNISGDGYNSWVVLDKNACKTIYLTPGDYKVLEVEPHDYTLESVYGDLTENNGTLTVVTGNNYEVTFNNVYEQKGFYHSFGRIVNIVRNATS